MLWGVCSLAAAESAGYCPVLGGCGAPGEKAMGQLDEDSITMGVAAGLMPLGALARDNIDGGISPLPRHHTKKTVCPGDCYGVGPGQQTCIRPILPIPYGPGPWR